MPRLRLHRKSTVLLAEPAAEELTPEDMQLWSYIRSKSIDFAEVAYQARLAKADPSRRALYHEVLCCFESAGWCIDFRVDGPTVSVATYIKRRSWLVRHLGFSPRTELRIAFHGRTPAGDRLILNRVGNLAMRAGDSVRGSDSEDFLSELVGIASAVAAETDPMGLPQHVRDQLDLDVAAAEARLPVLAQRGANLTYLIAMVVALVPAVAIGLLTAWAISLAHEASVHTHTYVAAFAFGAVGAIVSVILRMSHGRFQLDPTLGRRWTQILGAFRPIIGGIFGALSYFILAGNVLPVTLTPDPARRFFAYCVVAFVAGFSERFARDMLFAAARAKPGTEDESFESPSQQQIPMADTDTA